jgi:hypothetical protein
LKKSLESLDIETASDAISGKFKGIIKRELRQPKPGLESLYRFTPDGKVELLKTPSSTPMTIGLLLYAYDPDAVTSEEMLTRGIKPGDYVSQTLYKKYFDKTPNDKHVLSQTGRIWVENEVVPKLVKTETNKARQTAK